MKYYLIVLCFVGCFIGCTKHKSLVGQYIDNKKEGIHVQHDSIGRIEIATYKNGLLDGEYVLYHKSNNRIMRKKIYKANIENGQSYYFYSSGAMQSQREWRDGKKVGYGVDYYETGETEAVMQYNNDGFLVLRYTYDKKGKRIKEEIAQGK